MASYDLLYSFRTTQVLSSTLVAQVEMATCQTVPTGIAFTYGVPVDAFGALGTGPGAGILDSIATQIEELVSNMGVVGGYPGDTLDPSNLVTQNENLVVGYVTPQGNTVYGTATIPMSAFVSSETGIGGVTIGKTPGQYVQDVIATLESLAGG